MRKILVEEYKDGKRTGYSIIFPWDIGHAEALVRARKWLKPKEDELLVATTIEED